MRIDVELNTKSIQSAIKRLKHLQNLYSNETVAIEFIEEVVEWIIQRANWYVDNSSIGDNVKIDIKGGWEFVLTKNGAKITNKADQATFVEFGVGIVGSYNSHPRAEIEGYAYNVINPDSQPSKKATGVWAFNVDDIDDIDLRAGRYSTQTKKNGEIKVITKGSTPVMFAYNAVVDAKIQLYNSSGVLAEKWRMISERYMGKI